MKRAIIVGTGTVVGVVAAVTYQPQSVLTGMTNGAEASATTIVETTEPAATETVATTEPTPAASETAAHTNGTGNGTGKGAAAKASAAATAAATTTKTATPTPSATKTATTSGSTASTGTKTVNGSTVDVYYVEHGRSRYSGQLQVSVTVKDGVVSVINWLTYPGGEHIKYSEMAYQGSSLPLEGMTLSQVKNASIDTRTGATATSEAFVKSLQAALAKL